MVFRLVGHTRPERDVSTPGRMRQAAPKTMTVGRRKQYPNALRLAVKTILGDGPPVIEVFHGKQLVAICERQYRKVGRRGSKFSVVCSGEKPAKAKR